MDSLNVTDDGSEAENTPSVSLVIGNGNNEYKNVSNNDVVAKDVAPYHVVGGNPIRVIKKRFDDELIDILLKLKWWDLPSEELLDLLPTLCDPRLDIVREKLKEMLALKETADNT